VLVTTGLLAGLVVALMNQSRPKGRSSDKTSARRTAPKDAATRTKPVAVAGKSAPARKTAAKRPPEPEPEPEPKRQPRTRPRRDPGKPATVQDLIRAFKDGDVEDLAELVTQVDAMGPRVKDALPVLRKALQGRDRDLRRLAGLALHNMAPLLTDHVRDVMALLKEDSDAVKLAALDALGMMGASAAPAAEAMARALQDREPTVRCAAALALARVGPEARAAAPALVKALAASNDVQFLSLGIQALGRIQEGGKDVVAALQKLSRHEAHAVRLTAVHCLLLLAPEAVSLTECLRLAAGRYEGLSAAAEERAVQKIAALTKDDVPDFKAALRSGNVPACAAAVGALAALAADVDEPLRVATAITRLKVADEATAAIRTLVKALKVKDSSDVYGKQLRRDAAKALPVVGRPAVGVILAAVEKDFTGGKPSSAAFAGNEEARLEGLRVLEKMGAQADTPAARRVLAKLADSDPSAEVKAQAARTLRGLGVKK
jgi:hypothetical protein